MISFNNVNYLEPRVHHEPILEEYYSLRSQQVRDQRR